MRPILPKQFHLRNMHVTMDGQDKNMVDGCGV